VRTFFRFPNPVDEAAARTVAAGVVLMSVLFLATQSGWVLVVLAYGFIARVLAGPRISPLGRLAVHVVAPALPERFHRHVPGPPKRFAQGIGTAFSLGAGIAWLLGAPVVSVVLIVGLTLAASLEAGLGVCLGCIIFNRLMRWGLVPEAACEACNDLRLARPAS
jgi:hypothetical protein